MKFEKDYINQNKLRPEEAEEYWCENCCNYDRGQYEKGYIDGAKAFGARLKGIFEESGINDKGAIDYLLRRIECDHYKQYGDEHMCDCGSECQQAVIEKLCLIEEKLEKGELWEPSLQLCRSLAGVQIILSFANTGDPLEPNKIEWRKIINRELYGNSVVLMERDLLLMLPSFLEMVVEQIEHIEKEIYSEERRKNVYEK